MNGLLIGRFQPFHLGHLEALRFALSKVDKLWLGLGSSNKPTEKNQRKYILFDGDVDALWVENMNSVMDDNKLLTLANGERIRLQKHCALLVEVSGHVEHLFTSFIKDLIASSPGPHFTSIQFCLWRNARNGPRVKYHTGS